MNLINDAWIPVLRESGKGKIAPWQIAEKNDSVLELAAPRPDFQGALYQFLIGLLQTATAPEDHDEWLEWWEEMPDAELIKARFAELAPTFDFDKPDAAAFMQDFNLPEGEAKPISSLLIEAPGGKTVRDNLDHFIKRGTANGLCYSCAAQSLFTLQINAPSGGVGHRVGLRGGGPLTTLVMPTGRTKLWQKLWLNILGHDDIAGIGKSMDASVCPWLGPTRTSEKGGLETRPEDTHPLQVYWGMPRRIRVLFTHDNNGTCDLCGAENTALSHEFITRNYGVNYVGEWVHPLTPYRFDSKKEKPPLSIKGQKGGLGYRDWISLVLARSDDERAAKVTQVFMESRAHEIGAQRSPRLWCFGYDMDNMKARCWYDHILPLFFLDAAQQRNVLDWAGEFIGAAHDVADNLRQQIKAAWFRRPGDVKGDMSAVSQEFWGESETKFYSLLERLAKLPGDQRLAPPELYDEWKRVIQTLAVRIFDNWALASSAEDLDMKRIVTAREELKKKLHTSKPMKELIARSKNEKGGNDGKRSNVSLS